MIKRIVLNQQGNELFQKETHQGSAASMCLTEVIAHIQRVHGLRTHQTGFGELVHQFRVRQHVVEVAVNHCPIKGKLQVSWHINMIHLGQHGFCDQHGHESMTWTQSHKLHC